MATISPGVVVLGGPNGAGKSTAAPRLLRGSLKVEEFVNADTARAGTLRVPPEDVALRAGRIMLKRLDDLESQGKSFAFESTLASQALAQRLERLKKRAYRIHIVYLWLRLPTRHRSRCRTCSGRRPRCALRDVRRRFSRGRRNFFRRYRPLADTWRLYDASSIRGPRLVASGAAGRANTGARLRDLAPCVRGVPSMSDDDQRSTSCSRMDARLTRR